ncbi:MAG: hypothetical protein EOO77_33025 [Oxalobacteraceae bacterium]|nr:MAG: hypothetical protein EOO77_33025 [Oxalobacteraceae bacterium]
MKIPSRELIRRRIKQRYDFATGEISMSWLRWRGWSVLTIDTDRLDLVSAKSAYLITADKQFTYHATTRHVSAEVKLWLVEQCTDINGYLALGSGRLYFYFKNSSDAFAFKMRWL